MQLEPIPGCVGAGADLGVGPGKLPVGREDRRVERQGCSLEEAQTAAWVPGKLELVRRGWSWRVWWEMSTLPNVGGGQGRGFWNEQVGRLALNLEASDALLGRVGFSPEQEGATEVSRFGEGHNPFHVIHAGCSMEGSWRELAEAREVGGSGRIARGCFRREALV